MWIFITGLPKKLSLPKAISALPMVNFRKIGRNSNFPQGSVFSRNLYRSAGHMNQAAIFRCLRWVFFAPQNRIEQLSSFWPFNPQISTRQINKFFLGGPEFAGFAKEKHPS